MGEEGKTFRDYLLKGGVKGKTFEDSSGEKYTVKDVYIHYNLSRHPIAVVVNCVEWPENVHKNLIGCMSDLEVKTEQLTQSERPNPPLSLLMHE